MMRLDYWIAEQATESQSFSPKYPPDADEQDHIQIFLDMVARGAGQAHASGDPQNNDQPSDQQNEQTVLDDTLGERNGFSRDQIRWCMTRDAGYCQMPIIIDGEYYGPMYPATLGTQIHHIWPDYYLKRYAPADHLASWHNYPSNGINLCPEAHLLIHSTWQEQYKAAYLDYLQNIQDSDIYPTQEARTQTDNAGPLTFETFCELQAYYGNPMWNTTWDVALDAIATYNSVKFIWYINKEHPNGPARWYPFPAKSLIELRQRYKLLIESKQLLSIVQAHWEYLENHHIYERWENRIHGMRLHATVRKGYYRAQHIRRLLERIARQEDMGLPFSTK